MREFESEGCVFSEMEGARPPAESEWGGRAQQEPEERKYEKVFGEEKALCR